MDPIDNNSLPDLIKDAALLLPEYIRAEVALEMTGYFTPSSNRIKKILTKEKIVGQRKNPDGSVTRLKTTIIGTGKFGLPITSDLDYYRAFLKLLDEIVDREGRIPEPLSIPAKKLIRFAGKDVSAREIREVKDWIRRNRFTGIQGCVYRADKGDYEDMPFSPLFPDYRIRGEKLANGEIAETNLVWIAPWFATNYLHGYIRPLDFAFYQRLRKPIAKSLSPLLETGWYASGGKPYAKSYRDLCAEFLMKNRSFMADITRQLDPSHHELARERFLAKWEYHPARVKGDFIITYWPGPKFFEDQEARETRKKIADQILQKTKKLTRGSELSDGKQRLLDWVLDVCGDYQNEAAYRKMIQQYHEGTIETAIGETKQAKAEGRIRTTPGAYFMDTIKRLAALRARIA